MSREKNDHQVATIVTDEVYVKIRLAAAMHNTSISNWMRCLIQPAAEKAAKQYLAHTQEILNPKRKRFKGARR